MGESICLVRSFSQPAEFSSHETNEVVPRRVLTESVSFGRFANETLSWEKWSAFTQNRYLEEVERFTKPGSVAQMKAFFEAYFKSRATGRVTQTKKSEEVKVKTSDEIVCEIPKDIIVDSEVPLVVSNGMAMNEVRSGEVSDNKVDSVVPSVSVMDNTTDVQAGEVKVTTNVENFNTMAVLEDKALEEENCTSLSKERRPSSSGSKACNTSSLLEPSFVERLDHSVKNTRKESHLSSKTSITVSKNQRISPHQPVHMSISCAPSGNTNKTIVRIPQNGSRSSIIAKSAGKADKKKRSGPNSTLMSLNFAPFARQTTKTASKTLARNSTTQETTSSNARNSKNEPTGASKSRKRPLPRTSKEGSKAAKCSTSASVARLPEFPPPKNQLSADKRKNVSVGSSVSCKMSNYVERQPSVGSENLSTHSRSKAKSSMVSSPFVFRSAERAEKRKEFFKKLEEKNKREDAVQEQLSGGFKAKQNTRFASKEYKKNPQVGGFQVLPISLASQSFRRNKTPGTENIKRTHQTPHKASSMNIRNTKKAVMAKLKSCKIHPASKSQTTKKTQEIISPKQN